MTLLVPLLVIVLVVAVAVGGAAWLLGDLRTLPRAAGGAAASRTPSVSVVIPARNEEASLPRVLAALDSLTRPVGEVVVVDDDSADATAQVARAAGAHVVGAGPPPVGWTGKAWACHVGAEAADGDVLLFLDADTVLAPDALDGLLALHRQRGGLVSVQPFHTVERPYEQLSAYFNVVSLMGSAAFAGPRPPGGDPMAFGPCLLTTRVDLDRAGGHRAVRGAVLDDVELAAAYHRAGLAVTCAVGGDAIRMRSYPGGLRQLLAGWTKNVASGASASSTLPGLLAVAWICVHHLVAVAVLLALVEATTGRAASLTLGPAAVWAAAWVVLAAQLRWVLGRIGSFRWWTWALFPVPLVAFDVVFAVSAVQTGVRRSVSWRGRSVPLGSRPEVGRWRR